MHRARTIAVIAAASVCLAGCDRLGVFPERTENGRYQLMKDDRGQTLRLDTVTGSIVVVDPSTIPVERSTRRVAPSRAAAAAPVVETAVQPPLDTPAETQAKERSAEETPAVDTHPAEAAAVVVANPCTQIGEPGREFVISSRADAFVDPGRSGAPVANLATGTYVQGVSVQGTWLLVRFHDQVWGDRSAYISCSSVIAGTGERAGRARPTN
jgi:hypothetical protein